MLEALYVALCIFIGLCGVGIVGAIITLDVYFWDDYVDSDLNILWIFLTLPFIFIIDIITIVLLIKDAIETRRYVG